MNTPSEHLERLFTRNLDGECTPAERRQLDDLLRENPQVRADFENYRRLDELVGHAVRDAMGARPKTIQMPAWRRVARLAGLAAAACLAAAAWLYPGNPPQKANSDASQATMLGSWFAPVAADPVEAVPVEYERPGVRERGTRRDLIVIPGDEPGTYMVIELEHVRRQPSGAPQDF